MRCRSFAYFPKEQDEVKYNGIENGLALNFGALHLGEAKCETVEQMRLINTLCAVTALAEIKEAS